MFKHPHAVATRPTMRTHFRVTEKGIVIERIYEIETDLVLSPEAEGYDEETAEEFLNAVRAYHEAHPTYDLVEIVSKDSA